MNTVVMLLRVARLLLAVAASSLLVASNCRGTLAGGSIRFAPNRPAFTTTTGIVTLQSGNPFNVTTGKDISNTGGANRPFVVGNPAIGNPTILEWFNTAAFSRVVPGGGYSYGNAGRDILIGPGLQNFDLGLYKNFRLTERLGLQFRAEAFNALNHANFSNPTSDANSSSFGRISSTATQNREVEFGLKVLF